MNSSGFILLYSLANVRNGTGRKWFLWSCHIAGFIEITKNENDGKLISGYFETQATNANKDSFQIKGQFMNVKPH